MGVIFALIGGGWAIIGIANIINSPLLGGSDVAVTGLLMFNVLLFVLPGLVVFGLGYMMSSSEQKRKQQQTANRDTVQCPYCAEKIKSGAKICRFCNRELPEATATAEN